VVTNDPAIGEYLTRACERLILEPNARLEASALDLGAILWNDRSFEVSFNGRPLDVAGGAGGPLEAGIRGFAALLAVTLRRLRHQRALYALGLAKGAVCVAVAASSGVGKTTLALELLRRGWSTFGDELVLLDRESLVMQGIQLALMVREPSLVALGDERIAQATRSGSLVSMLNGVRTWHDVDIERTFGSSAVAAPRPLTHFVIYGRSEGGDCSLEPVSPAAAALEILPHFFIDSFRADDMWEVVEHLGRLRCFRLRAADHRTAADLIERIE
jgi:hypothetical protein